MKGIDSTGAPLVHVPGWMDGWVGGSNSRFKDCLQQSKKLCKLVFQSLQPIQYYSNPIKMGL
jgi:hypothetical protein